MCDFMILIMFEEKDSHALRLKKVLYQFRMERERAV